MIVLSYVKLGTIPFGPAQVKSKRQIPKIGDIIFIRENRKDKDKYSNPWEKVKIDKIDNNEIFFVSVVY